MEKKQTQQENRSQETVTISREEYERLVQERTRLQEENAQLEQLREENARLRQSYDNLLEQIRLAKKKQFGSSSENWVAWGSPSPGRP